MIPLPSHLPLLQRQHPDDDEAPRAALSSSSSSSSLSPSSSPRRVVAKRTGALLRSLLQRSSHHPCRHQSTEAAVKRKVAEPLKPTGRFLAMLTYSVGIVCLLSLLDATTSTASVIPTSDWNAQPLFTRAVRSVAMSGGVAATSRTRRRGLMRMCPPGGETFTSAWQMACGMRKRRKRDATAVEAPNEKLIIPTIALQPKLHRPPVGTNSVARPALLDEPYPTTDNHQYYAYSSESGESGGSGSASVGGGLSPPRLTGAAMDYLPYGGTVSGEEAPAKLVFPPALPASLSAAIDAEAELRLLNSAPAPPRGNTAAGGSLVIDTVEMPDVDRVPFAGHQAVAAEASTHHNHHYRAPSITEMMTVCCAYGCSLRDLLPYCSPFGDWDDY